jgi:chromosome segregation ATPase
MPDKPISDRLDDCEKFEADLQTELVKHSGRLDELKKIIEGQDVRIRELSEVIKQFQSDFRKDFQALNQLEALKNLATNAPRTMLPADGQAAYDRALARLTERYSGN